MYYPLGNYLFVVYMHFALQAEFVPELSTKQLIIGRDITSTTCHYISKTF